MSLQFRKCVMEDLPVLRQFSRTMYYETFQSMCANEDMEAYLNESFAQEKIQAELDNPDSAFYFLHLDNSLAGYMKLNDALAQTDLNDTHSLELERIYVTREAQGNGLGTFLMNRAIEISAQKGKTFLWLGVWEKNTKAISFYHRHGFYEIGTHTFVMGDDVQTDFIMRKDL